MQKSWWIDSRPGDRSTAQSRSRLLKFMLNTQSRIESESVISTRRLDYVAQALLPAPTSEGCGTLALSCVNLYPLGAWKRVRKRLPRKRLAGIMSKEAG